MLLLLLLLLLLLEDVVRRLAVLRLGHLELSELQHQRSSAPGTISTSTIGTSTTSSGSSGVLLLLLLLLLVVVVVVVVVVVDGLLGVGEEAEEVCAGNGLGAEVELVVELHAQVPERTPRLLQQRARRRHLHRSRTVEATVAL